MRSQPLDYVALGRAGTGCERFTALQRYGRERAEALGIGPEDSETLVDEMRSAQN